MSSLVSLLRRQCAPAAGAAQAFLRWWLSELDTMASEVIGDRLAPAQSRARLEILQDQIVLHLRSSGRWIEAQRSARPSELDQLAPAIAELMANQAPSARDVEVCLPTDRMLQRRVDLPSAVRPRLRAAIEYQLDRLTPFRPADLYFDCIEGAPSKRPGFLSAILAVTPRKPLDAIVAAVDPEGTRRVTVGAATSENAAASFRFLRRRGQRRRSVMDRVEYALTAGVGLLAVALLVVMALHQSAEQKLIDRRIEALRVQAKQAEDARTALEQRLTRASFLAQQLASVDTAEVLSTLTRDLPADAWVFQFQQEGDALEITGFAKNASVVAAALEHKPAFGSAQLKSAMQLPGSPNERFDIALTLHKTASRDGGAP